MAKKWMVFDQRHLFPICIIALIIYYSSTTSILNSIPKTKIGKPLKVAKDIAHHAVEIDFTGIPLTHTRHEVVQGTKKVEHNATQKTSKRRRFINLHRTGYLLINNPRLINKTIIESVKLADDIDRGSDYIFEVLDGKVTTVKATFKPLIITEKSSTTEDRDHLRYILEWTPSYNAPFNLLKKYTRASFIDNNCEYTNCYVTDDKNFLKNLTDFHAIMFNAKEVNNWQFRLPKWRSTKQKYVVVSTEPAPKSVVFDAVFDDYFNWTWTYRLDSDIVWKYVTIYDLSNTVVGPSIKMKWPKKMLDINDTLKIKLGSKTKLAAWFVSRCYQHRQRFANNLKSKLNTFNLTIDIYGNCGDHTCGTRKNSSECFKMIERDYYFYFAFENSWDEDYVTEKLISALNNYAVPVVYGGANYFRFLPPGSYLDARKLGPDKLAKTMNAIIRNSSVYHDFFRWRNHFRYELTTETRELCSICTALNSQKLMARSSHKKFRSWWNKGRQIIYEKVMSYITNTESTTLANQTEGCK